MGHVSSDSVADLLQRNHIIITTDAGMNEAMPHELLIHHPSCPKHLLVAAAQHGHVAVMETLLSSSIALSSSFVSRSAPPVLVHGRNSFHMLDAVDCL